VSQKKKVSKVELEKFLRYHKSKAQKLSEEITELSKETKENIQKARERTKACFEGNSSV